MQMMYELKIEFQHSLFELLWYVSYSFCKSVQLPRKLSKQHQWNYIIMKYLFPNISVSLNNTIINSDS